MNLNYHRPIWDDDELTDYEREQLEYERRDIDDDNWLSVDLAEREDEDFERAHDAYVERTFDPDTREF